jgi:hypothetical protein
MEHQKGFVGHAAHCARRSALLAITLLLFLLAAPEAPADVRAVDAANPGTVVSLTFDHNLKNQMVLGPLLAKYGMRGTFFVNSGLVGSDSYYYMDWVDLQAIRAAGNEIGGHTLTHADPAKLTLDEQRNEVCADRSNLVGHGFQVVSFAHPYGADGIGQAIVRGCGYSSARAIGAGVECSASCNYTETIPPADRFATRTTPHVHKGTPLSTLQSYVTKAETSGGGWVQFVITHICDECDEYSIPAATLEDFLAWLQPRAAQGTVVKTVAEVIGGAPQPLQVGNPFARDTVNPMISSLSLKRRSFRVAKATTPQAARAKRGTAFRYTLSEPATVTIEIQRKRRCRSRAACKRYRSVGTLTRKAALLRNSTRFSGRIGKRALRRGRYRAVVRATDAAGNRSAARKASFKVVRR